MILHADVIGSTALVQRDETLAHERIRDAFTRFSQTIRAYGGTPQELRGDALLATFGRASDAVSASLSFQSANASHNETLADGMRPQVRIGIAIGEVIIADGTLTGSDVVMAQRIEQLADPGGVCIQGTAFETIPRRLSFEYSSLGKQRLKGFDEPVRVYAVKHRPGSDIPPPEPQNAATLVAGRRAPVVALLAALVIAAGVIVWLQPWKSDAGLSGMGSSATGPLDRPSIAVLPFDNLSGDASQGYFADGMTEDIITDLSKISGLFVVARNSSFAYRGKSVDIKNVGRELGVKYVLEGSIQRAGDEIRVNAQLIDAVSGGHLWAERIDGPSTDVFKLQDEVTHQIVRALKVRMTAAEQRRLSSSVKLDPQAYDLFLQAQQLARTFRQEDREEMLKLYGHAVKLEPDFAEAHAQLAKVAYDVARVDHFWILPQPQALALTERHAQRALALEPDNATALATLAHKALEAGQTDRAFEMIEQAVAAAPSNVDVVSRQAYILSRGGRHRDAVTTADLVLRLEPNPTAAQLIIVSNVYLHAGRYEESVEYGERSKEMGIRPIWALETLVAGYARLKIQSKLDQAMAELRAAWPDINLRFYRHQFDYFRPQATLDHWIGSLALAGIPEWPHGVAPSPQNMLTEAEMAAVFSPDVQRIGEQFGGSGGRWHSVDEPDGSYETTWLSSRGSQFEFKGVQTRLIMAQGDRQVQQRCTREPDHDMGRERCGLILRNTGGSKATRDEYLSASYRGVSKFAVFPRKEQVDWTRPPG